MTKLAASGRRRVGVEITKEPLWQQIRAENRNEHEHNPFYTARSIEMIWSHVAKIMVHDIRGGLKKGAFAHGQRQKVQEPGRSSRTSLVFHRCLSFGSEVHFGRHSSSFLGRYIFKCPCSSTR